MKSLRLGLGILLVLSSLNASHSQTPPDYASLFEGFDGCFVLYDVNRNTYVRYKEPRCEERLSPCSTFKIPNSLIGLETGVIADATHIYVWDGVDRQRDSWNQDHDLRSAIANSVVWYYQKLASEVGEARMKEWMEKLNYGNGDISGGLTTFWLGSSLKISANEQVAFLAQLYKNALPFSPRSMDIVRDILILAKTDQYIFRGKTGSGVEPDVQSWGWFVGYVEREGNAFVFAVNIKAKEGANGQKAREIAENILRNLSLIQ